MNKILEIVNDILNDKYLPGIGVDDDLKLSGFSSPDMLILILRLEKCGYNIANIAIQSIESVNDLYHKIERGIGGRTII